jgi:hypothetical protein
VLTRAASRVGRRLERRLNADGRRDITAVDWYRVRVTAVPGIPRKEQLRILGNGVVPRQAHHAYGLLLEAHVPAHLKGKAAA